MKRFPHLETPVEIKFIEDVAAVHDVEICVGRNRIIIMVKGPDMIDMDHDDLVRTIWLWIEKQFGFE